MTKLPDNDPKSDSNDSVLTLAHESLNVSKQKVPDGCVKVTRSTAEHEETVNMLLEQQSADVKRIPKAEYVDAIPAIRELDGVLIIPVVEEEIEVVRRLVLREELHISTQTRQVLHQEKVTLRKQRVEIYHEKDAPLSDPANSDPVNEEKIMAHEKIATLFSNFAQAEGAKRNLIKAGYREHDIDIISGERLRSEDHEARHPGLWQRLFGDKVDDEQAEVYEEAISTGGVVLTLRAEEDELPRAVGIIDAHDTTPQANAQAGYANNTAALGTKAPLTPAPHSPVNATSNTTPNAVRTSLTGDESEEEILRLAEEHLEVGKRLISEGSTRVRRYTVTDEVSKDISLQEQHADIFRRPLNQTGAPGSIDWSEKTVEIEETHEQPVINKTAQVKEEVVVRKDVNDRVETINDSVRRQEVDIDHNASATQFGEKKERLGEREKVADVKDKY